jgi:hypothetical protein
MIRYNDLQLGKLIEHLRSIDLYQDALIIIAGDHGEALGDETDALGRSIVGHGGEPTESKVRVPLIIKYPENRGGGKVVDGPVSIVDIYATVLSEFGAMTPSNVESEVLTQHEPTDPNRGLLIESQPSPDSLYWGAVRTADSKYTILKQPSIKQPKKLAKYAIERILRGDERIEGIGTQVGDNLMTIQQGQERYRELLERCTSLRNQLFSDFDQSQSDSVDEEVKDQLRKLGYFN